MSYYNQEADKFNQMMENLDTKERLAQAQTLEEEKAILAEAMAKSKFMKEVFGRTQ